MNSHTKIVSSINFDPNDWFTNLQTYWPVGLKFDGYIVTSMVAIKRHSTTNH